MEFFGQLRKRLERKNQLNWWIFNFSPLRFGSIFESDECLVFSRYVFKNWCETYHSLQETAMPRAHVANEKSHGNKKKLPDTDGKGFIFGLPLLGGCPSKPWFTVGKSSIHVYESWTNFLPSQPSLWLVHGYHLGCIPRCTKITSKIKIFTDPVLPQPDADFPGILRGRFFASPSHFCSYQDPSKGCQENP